MRVADIGAGDGYYVARLSPLVGETGRVFGQDIMPDYLALLQRRVRRDGLANVQVVAGDPHDPRLPATSVDVALMIHMYHEIAQPYALLWNLATAMRPGGTLVILDLERPTYGHGTPPDLLRCELKSVGYRERSFTRTASEEYVAIFVAPDSLSRPTPEAIMAARRRGPRRAPPARPAPPPRLSRRTPTPSTWRRGCASRWRSWTCRPLPPVVPAGSM
jgi:SAM-dependent methyltransferase